MGFFKSFKKIVSRVVVGVATGGISEVARAVAPKTRSTFDALGSLASNVFLPTSPQQLIGLGAAAITKNPTFLATSLQGGTVSQSTQPFSGGNPAMAIDIGGLLKGISGVFGTGGTGIGSTIGNVASLASGFFPSPQMSQVVQTAVAPMSAPMAMMVRSGGMLPAPVNLTKEIFDAGAKMLMRLGLTFPATAGGFSSALKRALSSIASLARRTPTGTMVSVLIGLGDRKSTRLNSSHSQISYAVFCLKKKYLNSWRIRVLPLK